MNWLRRLIPWAFRHDMQVDQTVLWNAERELCELRLVCRRCGYKGDYYEMSEWEEFSRGFLERGCRGAR